MTPPDCAWCGYPATEQLHVGTNTRTGQRHYSWVCAPCMLTALEERDWQESR